MCATSYPCLSRTCCPITALPARTQWGKQVLIQLRQNETLGEKVLVNARSESFRSLLLPSLKKMFNSPQGSYWLTKEPWKSKCTSPGHLLVTLQVRSPAEDSLNSQLSSGSQASAATGPAHEAGKKLYFCFGNVWNTNWASLDCTERATIALPFYIHNTEIMLRSMCSHFYQHRAAMEIDFAIRTTHLLL